MLMILSAKIVSEDIALQFGRLPPSFLPLGGRRLFELQVEIAFGEPVFMTVPESYIIPQTDAISLKRAGITLLPQPSNMSLPAAIGDALSRTRQFKNVRILYGDTLIKAPKKEILREDLIFVQNTTSNYPWAFVQLNDSGETTFSDAPPKDLEQRRVVCGYYNFSDAEVLSVACAKKTIVEALKYYDKCKPLICKDAEEWLDFGHLPFYFRSMNNILVKRIFNEFRYENQFLLKKSSNTNKMRAEANWYENLPKQLQLHVPRYAGRIERDFQAGYGLEYLYAPLLSDLFVFGELPLASWLEIIQACFEFLQRCQNIKPPDGAPESSQKFASDFFDDIFVKKSWTRLRLYSKQSKISLNAKIYLDGVQFASLESVVKRLIAKITPTKPENIVFWHGDFFFGNIFYDFTSQRILCIDPRGHLESGAFCLWGDYRYDVAKLAHSIIGQYDRILLGRSQLIEAGPLDWKLEVDEHPEQENIERIFSEFSVGACDIQLEELLSITALLFFSMLPLHSDKPNLQRHLLAMGLRLANQVNEST